MLLGALPSDSCRIAVVQILLGETTAVDGLSLTTVSYHAPPGVTWEIVKPRQAVTFARWLSAQQGPVLLGADANTPKVDAVEFAATRTWWHSGDRRLNGEPGEDLLLGPGKIHPLEDGLRRWLANRPAETAALADHRQARWRSPTAPANERTHPEPADDTTASGSPPTGPSSTSTTSTTNASTPAATTPWSSPTLLLDNHTQRNRDPEYAPNGLGSVLELL